MTLQDYIIQQKLQRNMCLNPSVKRVRKSKGTKKGYQYRVSPDSPNTYQTNHTARKVIVPCGRCSQCISQKRSEWAFRLYWESKDHPSAHLVTLTYGEPFVWWLNNTTGQMERGKDLEKMEMVYPRDMDNIQKVVDKRDCQLFLKRLHRAQNYQRQRIGLPQDQKLRYFLVSEYGEKGTARPHYHIIFFGLTDYAVKKLHQNKLWEYGFTDIKPLDTRTKKAFYYVTKYLYKQKLAKSRIVPPFSLMSKRPYIGQRFERVMKEYMLKHNTFMMPGVAKNEIIPSIYREKLPQVKQHIAKHNMSVHLDIQKENINKKLYHGKNPDLEVLKEAVISESRLNREVQQLKQLREL